MKIYNKPIIEYIPHFLEYCKIEKGLSSLTIKNYAQFLSKFVAWLNNKNLSYLTPQNLSEMHIQQYILYLSSNGTNFATSHKMLAKNTQNYYLIALRVLLSYFLEKNIHSILPDKIKLPKNEKTQSKNLSSEIIASLMKIKDLPNVSNLIGLRDGVLLDILFNTGLKVSQLVALNKDDIIIDKSPNRKIKMNIYINKGLEIVNIPQETVQLLKLYLKNRNDSDPALFIALGKNTKKPVSYRITTRTVQRIINKYAKKLKIQLNVTPEFLRSVFIIKLLEKERAIKINNIFSHEIILVERYDSNDYLNTAPHNHNSIISWNAAEEAINKELEWLKNNIFTMPGRYSQQSPIFIGCDNCIFRKIAILIVSGVLKVVKIKAKYKTLWHKYEENNYPINVKKHGKEWHQKMISIISNYLKSTGYEIKHEPILNFGRADIGAYSKNSSSFIYVEVGTVSLFKLWYNFLTMKNTTFVIVPSEKYAIEFKL